MNNLFKRIYKQNKYKLMDNNQKKLFSYEFKTFKLNDKITFTNKEEKIFSIIKNVINKYNLNKVECRVAGGWVRDKVKKINLLNIDIDIITKIYKTFFKYIYFIIF